ncbi:LysR family transcriptional regulator [Mesocricetibacter intestinalis]|uniref:LysR family transcriptional regulator n=1 Tax=Mesocricetibacter intestinalis TaxID=1521930 RepID=A0A4R6V6R2_9PAST|nr:LysR family transcriptional regulator [Mesocricetibacter intestinalis]TDQ56827.1 LysR family transcriptional regulator [Mesocricetibacter intestinalis]
MRQQENYNNLHAFLVVAQEASFTRAAGKLGISQSALSHIIKQLETRLGVQLFTRTTRSLSLTQAGQKLFGAVEQGFQKIDNELKKLAHFRTSPAGLVRINTGSQVVNTLLLPKLADFSENYPDIQLELISENRFVDIVAEGFDAGVRFGNAVAEGMIAVPISAETRMAAVASPDYFHRYGFPKKVRDLEQHQCIGYRLDSGGLFLWEFHHNNETIKIKPQGRWIFNEDTPALIAAKKGLGIAYLPEDQVVAELASGELIRIFSEQSHVFPSFYLYYPHRNVSPALRAVIDALRM